MSGEDRQIFTEVFDREVSPRTGITMDYPFISYRGEIQMNIADDRLSYALYRLTKLMNDVGEFR